MTSVPINNKPFHNPGRQNCFYPHFTDLDAEAQGGSQKVEALGLEVGSVQSETLDSSWDSTLSGAGGREPWKLWGPRGIWQTLPAAYSDLLPLWACSWFHTL